MRKTKSITKGKKMATKYVIFKRYEKRVGAGKFPEITRLYISESLPHVELTRNVDEAMRFTKDEAEQIAYVTCMDYEEIK